MRKYFIDVTPIVYDMNGSPTKLGTARYEVTDDMIGNVGSLPYGVLLGPNPPMYLPGNYSGRVMFDVHVTNADAPQPTQIEAVK